MAEGAESCTMAFKRLVMGSLSQPPTYNQPLHFAEKRHQLASPREARVKTCSSFFLPRAKKENDMQGKLKP